MITQLIKKAKHTAVTLRFSILAIFVTLLCVAMLSLITVMHIRLTQNMPKVALQLMYQTSRAAFHMLEVEINKLENVETKIQASKDLLELGVINPDNQALLTNYAVDLIKQESKAFPSLTSFYWADNTGNFIMAQRQTDGTLLSETIDRRTATPTTTITYYDSQGKTIKSAITNNAAYDPRTTPWYLAAETAKQMTWLPIYHSNLTQTLGTSVTIPITKNHTIVGAISFNLQLNALRNLVEAAKISPHGSVFIVNQQGQLIAFPGLVQYTQPTLLNIHQLSAFPWVSQAFDQFIKTKQSEFFLYNNKIKYVASFNLLLKAGTHEWFYGAIAPERDFTKDLRRDYLITMIAAFTTLFISIAIVSNLVSRVVHPLKNITKEIQKIKDFDLTEHAPILSRIKEINYISEALVAMKQGLRSFQKYVPASLVRQLIKVGEAAHVGGEKKPLAILFSDIQNFTAISEHMSPDQLMQHICEYFDALSQIISAQHGTIDKYIGDAIMVFWGAPLPNANSCHQAATAALLCVKKLQILNTQWRAEGKPALVTRFGIHAGEAIVGNLGSSERLNYTAIGDAVNLASRLESINKTYGTHIIVSAAVYQTIKNQFVLRMLDYVTLKGKEEATYIYELITDSFSQPPYDVKTYTALFETGFSMYQNKRWDNAVQYFTQCQAIYPEDTIATLFIQRCDQLKSNPPPQDWNGIWHLKEK
ncbi:MAG: hypothetical protein A3E83_00240 [Gammaproteobacteria bacterium RIFCSPHIGHO2_12_FULL_41_20]|nr:MAG: hypothetical protein A3E83_00240 [Gammaproteobacteria bacterium RIFCSPHIGHO2_12_FULL_41_20]